MKKTLKSFLLLTLSMVTVLSIFAGCQDKKSDSSNSYKTSDIYDSSKPYTGKFVN